MRLVRRLLPSCVTGLNRTCLRSLCRWLRPDHPDTHDNVKAKALLEFAKFRKQWVEKNHGFTPKLFFWIDVACGK